ncbi:hypothetical protein HY214_02490 [Candidatus Roizmanbacteria bacterium]|nr:hypothetical protein [Candidatus Roizmanbacteria bacterium]
MLNENFVILAALINLLGAASYIKNTIKGKVKPNRVSWGLWTAAAMIAFLAELAQGVGILSLATFMVGFGPLLIFLASFVNKKSYWKISTFDKWCGALSVVGLVLWYITKVGNIAIAFSIFADLMAGIPTLVKSYKYPETENWIAYMFSIISISIALLTIKTWTFPSYGFPLYILIFDSTAFLLIKFKLGKRIKTA